MNMRIKEERKKELEHELERVTKMLRKDKEIRLVMLFGSLARGDVSGKSDMDMIIIKNTKKRFLDRLDEIYSTLVPNVALDIFVYTPEEFKLMKNRSFIMNAMKEGKILHEA
ncbi:MAG: nucleotidyltransferase domain-containing protein [Methanophagales archaeon]|nr:nucleotidyltransferase domain-containing protein [Methanophagales archaeon]